MPRMMDGSYQRRKQRRKRTMNFGIWNIQGLRNKQQEIIQELVGRKIDVAILSETKKKGNGSENTKEYIHFFSGVAKDKRAKAGISIFIHKKYQKRIKSWEPINERFIKVTILLKGKNFTILGIYALNDDATVQEKNDFEEDINTILDEIPSTHELIIGGDLNARVGRQINSRIVGMHGESVVNNNGQRLINICQQYHLKIMNGFFAHKEIHKYTWHQHTRGLKSIIDYLIIKQQTTLRVQDVKVSRGADCGSDHCLVVAKIYMPFAGTILEIAKNDRSRIDNTRYNLDSLENESTRLLYYWRLKQKLTEIKRTTEEEYEHIKLCIKEAAEEALGPEERKSRKTYWWDGEIEEKIKRKKEVYQKLLQNGDDETRREYKELNREVKQEVIRKKNKAWENKCEYIDSRIGGAKSSEAWKIIKLVRTTNKTNNALNSISDEQWIQYFKELLTETRPNFLAPLDEEEPSVLERKQGNVHLSTEQLREAVKGMKLKKSPGPGGIYAELIKYGPPKLLTMMRNLFERCLNGETIPEEWRQSYISPIHKKGPKNDPRNYRGIAVTPTIGRLYSRVLRNLIEEEIREKQPEEQAGFRAGRSTIDNAFTLKIALEKRVQRNRETHVALIDLEKAYDNVPISRLWEEMKHLEINPLLIRAIQKYYENNLARIKIGNEVTTSFSTTKGLRQGCCLSPTLFKIYLDRALVNWVRKCKTMGLRIGDDTLFTLFFADDQIVIAEDEQDLNYMIRKLKVEYEAAGLQMNLSKCEYLIVGNEEVSDLILDTDKLKGVKCAKYLGIIFNKKGNSENEIQERINKGRTVTRALNSLLWSKKITRATKKHIYRSLVQSVTLYGSEIWDVTKSNKNKLMATEMDFLRRSCGRSKLERVKNDDIRGQMQMGSNIHGDIEKRQLTWFGHVKRMNDDRWPRKVLEWIPLERKKRGRPRRSWRDDIDQAMVARNLEEDEVFDRKGWKLGTERRQQL